MPSVKRSFFGFPFLRNHSEVELARDALAVSICNICGTVSSEITSLTCSHRICILCFDDISRTSDVECVSCPIERTATSLTDLKVRNDIPQLLSSSNAFCFNRSKGCDFVGPLSSLQAHYSFCPYHEVQCQLCETQVLRKYLLHHVRSNCGEVYEDSVLRSLRETSSNECDAGRRNRPLRVTGGEFNRLTTHFTELNLDMKNSFEEKTDVICTSLDNFQNTVQRLPAVLNQELKNFDRKLNELRCNIERTLKSRVPVWNSSLNEILRSPETFFRWKVQFDPDVKRGFLKGNRLLSQMFLSHDTGYTLFLGIKGTGKDSEGLCTHLGISLHTTSGPNDDSLEWPFRWDYSFKVLNHSNLEKSVECSIKWDCVSDCLRKKYSCLGNPGEYGDNGFGESEVISLKELESAGYLLDNTFTVEFSIDPKIRKARTVLTRQ